MPLAADEAPQIVDLFRVIALILGSFTVAAVGVVCAVYVVVWRKHNALWRAGRVPKWRGMLPRHVVGVSIAFAGLTLCTMYELMIRLREPLTGRSFIYAALYIVGMMALWDVLGHSRYRLHGMKDTPPDNTPNSLNVLPPEGIPEP